MMWEPLRETGNSVQLDAVHELVLADERNPQLALPTNDYQKWFGIEVFRKSRLDTVLLDGDELVERAKLVQQLRERGTCPAADRNDGLGFSWNFVRADTEDPNGDVVSRVWTEVREVHGCKFRFPANFPMNDSVLVLLSGLGREDQVRVLCQLVRIQSEVVAFLRFERSLLGSGRSDLCFLVSLLSAAVHEDTEGDRGYEAPEGYESCDTGDNDGWFQRGIGDELLPPVFMVRGGRIEAWTSPVGFVSRSYSEVSA